MKPRMGPRAVPCSWHGGLHQPPPPPLLGWVPHSGRMPDLIFLPISKVALEWAADFPGTGAWWRKCHLWAGPCSPLQPWGSRKGTELKVTSPSLSSALSTQVALGRSRLFLNLAFLT